MKALVRTVSAAALIGTILPPFLYLVGRIALGSVHVFMLVATLVWFASAPLWMNERHS
jgi:hypothetical protein